MKELSRDDIKKRQGLIDEIMTAHTDLENEIKACNKALMEAKPKVKEKLDALNSKIQEAQEWAEVLAGDMQNYYDEKSERWQESEKGQNYDSWKGEYENFSPDEIDVDFPEELDVPDCCVADGLENLPDEP